MLLLLYLCTKDSRPFNSFARKIVFHLELPIITLIFRLAGVHKAIPRNSILEPDIFNIFMSDLDFSIVCEEHQVRFFYSLKRSLNKIFLNLGEIEFYTLDEWRELSDLTNNPHNLVWDYVYRIRKTQWQKKKLERAQDRYEQEKQNRALKISQTKLDKFSSLLNSRGGIKVYSHFLEADVEIHSELYDVLPDNDAIPSSQSMRDIKALIIRREYLLTVTSMRSRKQEDRALDFSRERDWLNALERRYQSLFFFDER